MAYVITDECVSCGTCESECPSEAYTFVSDYVCHCCFLLYIPSWGSDPILIYLLWEYKY